jgi:hypothetical protein
MREAFPRDYHAGGETNTITDIAETKEEAPIQYSGGKRGRTLYGPLCRVLGSGTVLLLHIQFFQTGSPFHYLSAESSNDME